MRKDRVFSSFIFFERPRDSETQARHSVRYFLTCPQSSMIPSRDIICYLKGLDELPFSDSENVEDKVLDNILFQNAMKLSVLVGKLVLHASSAMKSLEAQEGPYYRPNGGQEVLIHPDDAR